MISPWLNEIIANKFPSSLENNSREIVRGLAEKYQRTHHPKVGRELENLMPDLAIEPERYHDDQAGDPLGYVPN